MMNTFKKTSVRCLSVFLVLLMLFTGIPVTAFADSNSSEMPAVSESVSSDSDVTSSIPEDVSSEPEETDSSSEVPLEPGSSSLIDGESESESVSLPQGNEGEQFLQLVEESSVFDAKVGDTVEMYVKLNRDDVAVTYQWQKLMSESSEESSIIGKALYDYSEGESTDYLFLIEDMTEAELLEINPDATWPGIEMYYDQLEKAGGDASDIHIENGTHNYILEPDAEVQESDEINQWVDIEGETESSYLHTVEATDDTTSYRCLITIVDEEYLLFLDNLNAQEAEGESEKEAIIPDDAIVSDSFFSDSMNICLKTEAPAQAPKRAMLSMPVVAADVDDDVQLSGDNQWVLNVRPSMEYITEDTYSKHNGKEADNPYWTRLDGGIRPDGTKYGKTSLTDNTKMEVLSAWYGKRVYFRMQGTSDYLYSIDVPAYTGVDYQTGAKTLYKSSVKVLNVWVADTGKSFYGAYLFAVADESGYLDNGCHITINKAVIDSFNKQPNSILTNAEGDYIYDLVVVGSCVSSEPDISGAAAWALRDYMCEGYGFMVGHDTMYGYAGVTDSNYVPDKNSLTTPYYTLNTKKNGHWNMNWLMGQNAMYSDVSPYNAASMILCAGDYRDKSTMYGDGEGTSVLRIKSVLPGNPIADVSSRCPTNFPYATYENGNTISPNSTFNGSATHSNQQIAYGKVWIDYASDGLKSIGSGVEVTDVSNGLVGTNNFYLTTNGNFGMSQIGHIKDNYNIARIDECRVLANTIMYLSQRQQCQVCQSEQDNNKIIHFVHKVNSVEQLEKLKNQEENWFTYPMDGCYMLTADIVLPDDWTPIKGFYGHFDADGHSVTLTNGKPLFDNTNGVLGEFDAGAFDERGWNLGTDSTVGHNKIYDDAGERITGSARVVGYLSALFGTDNTVDWSNKIVVVDGTDGKQYFCNTNADGKYVVSNTPCTGIMTAHVYRTDSIAEASEDNEVVEYGAIRVNVPASFWNTNETTPLYLIGMEALPVKDTTVYEEQTALMLEGGVVCPQSVTDIVWQFSDSNGKVWTNIEDGHFDFEVSEPVFEKGEEATQNRTLTTLTIKNAKQYMDGTYFRAVFNCGGGKTLDTFSVRVSEKSGKLSVLPRPITVVHPDDVTIFAGESAQFISTAQFFKKFGEGLDVVWQYRTAGNDWQELDKNYLLANSVIETKSENASAGDTTLQPYLNTTTLNLENCPSSVTRYQFRAVYSYTNEIGTVFYASSEEDTLSKGHEGYLFVKLPSITATISENQIVTVSDIESGKAESEIISTDTATYTSIITYSPGMLQGANTAAAPTVEWVYKDSATGEYSEWSQEVANALYPGSGIKVTIETSEPVMTGSPYEYQVTSVMTITNIPLTMDKGTTHYWFHTNAATTHLEDNVSVRSENADLSVNADIEIHHKTETYTTNPDGSKTVEYKELEIVAPVGLRQMSVQFTTSTRDTRNKIVADAIELPENILVTGKESTGYTFKSQDGGLIPVEVWQGIARQLQFVVYDENTAIYWRIDEETQSAEYNSDNGHFYEYVSAEGINWTDSKNEAGQKFNADLNAWGYLVNINDAKENAYIQELVGNRKAWIGGTKNTDFTGLDEGSWAWMQAAELNGREMDYVGWADNEPATDDSEKLYAVMNADGKWSAERNDGQVTVTAKDLSTLENKRIDFPESGGKGYVDSNAITLIKGHQYFIAARYGDFGDANTAVEFKFDAFGILNKSVNNGAAAVYAQIHTYEGEDGDYKARFTNKDTGVNVTGNYGMLYYFDVVDLTDTYGAGNEPSLDYCKATFANQFGGQKNLSTVLPHIESITITTQSVITDKNGYVVEYGVGDDVLLRQPKNAFDTDIIGTAPENVKAEIVVTITAEDKLYDGIEQISSVSVVKKNGEELSAEDEAALLAALSVSYSTGTTTPIGENGSDCIDAKYYGTSVSVNNSADEIWAKYAIDPISSIIETGFTITPRGLHLISTGNNKVYDGTAIAKVENIVFKDATSDSGMVTGDTVSLKVAACVGRYNEINQTEGREISISRNSNSALTLIGADKDNYYIASETYTGAIQPRPLTVHSLYLDDGDVAHNPHNIKAYDDTTKAVIADITLDNVVAGDNIALDKREYEGTYASSDTIETLNSDGTVRENRLMLLGEIQINRTEPIALINNSYGNYYIAEEHYSGAIHRLTISASVTGYVVMYGDDFDEQPKVSEKYSASECGADANLSISSLVGDDVLVLDNTKSNFEMPSITNATPAGVYPMTYEGLNEENYPVLSNYVVWKSNSNVDVIPRPLKISVAGGYTKQYLSDNPTFEVTYSHQLSKPDASGNPVWKDGFATESDTAKSALSGTLIFETACAKDSPVKFNESGAYAPYFIYASGLNCKINKNGMQNYEIEWEYGDIVVTPKEIVVQIDDKKKTYGDSDPALTYKVLDVESNITYEESNNPFSEILVNPVVRKSGEDVGAYEIDMEAVNNPNYSVTIEKGTFTVLPAQLVITVNGGYSKTFGEDNPEFTVSYSGFKNGDTKDSALSGSLSYETEAGKHSAVGVYSIHAKGLTAKNGANGQPNYQIKWVDGDISIARKKIIVTIDDKTKVYGDNDPAFTYTVKDTSTNEVYSSSDNPFESVLTNPVERQSGEDVGEYTITMEPVQNTDYDVEIIDGTLVVTPAKLIISVDGGYTKKFGEDNPEFTVSYNGFKNSDTSSTALDGKLTFATDSNKNSSVGKYDVKASGQTAKKGNYEIEWVDGYITITPKTLTVQIDDKEKVYGDADPEFTYTVRDEDTDKVYDNDSHPFKDVLSPVERTEGEDTGKYPITMKPVTDNNYIVEINDGTLTVLPAKLVITVDGGYEKKYGEKNPEFTVSYTGFKNGDTKESALEGSLVFETDSDEEASVGNYDVTASGLTSKTGSNGSPNYEIEWVDGDITISPKQIVIQIDDKEKVYGDEDPELTYTVKDVDEDKTYDDEDNPFEDIIKPVERGDGEDVGGYIISTDPTDNPNYDITVEDGKLTIVPAKLIISVDGGYSKEEGEENPEFTVSYKGFKNGDTKETALEGVLQFVTDSDTESEPGTYDIQASGLTSKVGKNGLANYEIEWIDGDIAVTAKEPIPEEPGPKPEKPDKPHKPPVKPSTNPQTNDLLELILLFAIPAILLSVTIIIVVIKKKNKEE